MRFHVDEIDDDEAADIAQTQLPCDLLGGFQIGVARSRLNIAAPGAAGRIDVDRHQRLGVIDHQAAARGQSDLVRIGRLDLALDLVAREQRYRVLIELELALRVGGHEALHVFLGLLEGFRLIDEAFAYVIGEIVPQAPGHRIAFLEDQEGRRPPVVRGHDRVPSGLQIVQIPLQFFGGPADAGRTHDGAHAVGDLQPVHRLPHLIAVFALDAARYAARPGVVRHQHQKTACEADKGRERRTLVAALVLLDLNNQFLPFLQQILDVESAAGSRLRAEIFLRDLFERQETMALRAVFHESRFQTRLYAGNPPFIDIGFFLFPRRDLNR